MSSNTGSSPVRRYYGASPTMTVESYHTRGSESGRSDAYRRLSGASTYSKLSNKEIPLQVSPVRPIVRQESYADTFLREEALKAAASSAATTSQMQKASLLYSECVQGCSFIGMNHSTELLTIFSKSAQQVIDCMEPKWKRAGLPPPRVPSDKSLLSPTVKNISTPVRGIMSPRPCPQSVSPPHDSPPPITDTEDTLVGKLRGAPTPPPRAGLGTNLPVAPVAIAPPITNYPTRDFATLPASYPASDKQVPVSSYPVSDKQVPASSYPVSDKQVPASSYPASENRTPVVVSEYKPLASSCTASDNNTYSYSGNQVPAANQSSENKIPLTTNYYYDYKVPVDSKNNVAATTYPTSESKVPASASARLFSDRRVSAPSSENKVSSASEYTPYAKVTSNPASALERIQSSVIRDRPVSSLLDAADQSVLKASLERDREKQFAASMATESEIQKPFVGISGVSSGASPYYNDPNLLKKHDNSYRSDAAAPNSSLLDSVRDISAISNNSYSSADRDGVELTSAPPTSARVNPQIQSEHQDVSTVLNQVKEMERQLGTLKTSLIYHMSGQHSKGTSPPMSSIASHNR